MGENKSLNFMKGISCLTVILLHCPIPGVIGDGIIYAMRFPVPMFFMISGYFCYYKGTEWIKKAQLKTLKLLLCAEVIGGAVSFVFGDKSVSEQIRELSLWSDPLRTLFCGTLFNGTLWYLYAMLWTWMILYVVKKRGGIRWSYAAIPVLMLVHIVGRLYIQETGDIDVWIYLFRSALLFGVPFVLLGHFLAEKAEWIIERISNGKCVLLLFLGGIVMVMEFVVLNCYMDLWFSTVLVVSAMFLFAMVNPDREIIPIIAKIGKKYSMVLYMIHIPVSRILGRCFKPNMSSTAYEWVHPFATMATALLTAVIVARVRNLHTTRVR